MASIDQDPELARLVADMSVTQTPVARRDDGGSIGNAQAGTSVGSTVTGAPFTVWSGDNGRNGDRGIPREVDMSDEQGTEANMAGSNAKRFKIFVVPTWNTGFSAYCFQFIGQGASYCTARNCATSHHHSSVKTVMPGEIYVAKSSTTAFVTPAISDSVIEADVLAKWRTMSLTLTEWNEKFLIATAALDDIPVSTAAMEVHEEFFRSTALKFKTPAKRKRDSKDEESLAASLLDVSVYSPFFKADDDDVPISDLSKVNGALIQFDDGIFTNNEAILNFISEYRQEHGKAGGAIRSLHLRLEALAATVGSVPTHLSFDYLAPSAWASIGAMAEKLDEIDKSLKAQSLRLDSYKNEITTGVGKQVQECRDDFYGKLNSFKTAFISATRGLGGRLDNVELSMIGFVNASSTVQPLRVADPHSGLNRTADQVSRMAFHGALEQNRVTNVDEETAEQMGLRIETRVNHMEKRLNGLVAKSDERAIMFCGLGFLSIEESNAWLETEQMRHQSGLIVDIHMVFEHVFHSINGIDTLGILEKLYKIKVLTIADSIAMTSFDAKTPKYFSKLKGHHVLKLDASYFDAIVSHAEWSDGATGYKKRLQEALTEFETAHGTFIDHAVEIGSKANTVAHSALTESIAWITGFIQFVDEYYRDLTRAKFGAVKAWHVTTRLAKVILDEVGTPRNGVQGSFQVGNSNQICQKIFWAVLKSHDVMASYKRLNFKNHPSIATELVKFLAINTSFEVIDRLSAKTACLELDVSDGKKQVAAANKAAASAANKADECKLKLDSFSKRLQTLEGKVK